MKNSKHTIFFTAFALSLIFASCDKSNELDLSGEIVPIRIHSLGVVAGSSEDLTRSASLKESEIISKSIGNGLLLDMSIEQDASQLRLGTLEYLQPGTHFRVIAVEAGTTNYYSHGDFVVGSGINSLTSFHAHVGDAYDFICISYNTTDLPDDSDYEPGDPLPDLDVDNSTDLLWWIKENVTVNTAADVELEIKLTQRLAKIKVIIDCSYNEWEILVAASSITIGTVAIEGTLNWLTGGITPDSPAAQDLSFTNNANSTSQTSSQLTIIPKAIDYIYVTMSASAISRDGYSDIPTYETPVTFSTALDPGISYIFRMKVRTTIWAGSNIYWDGDENSGELFFDDAGDTDNQGFQGVFFKWGSLVGISPAQTNNGSMVDGFISSTPVYKPDGSGGWMPDTYTDWASIPFWDGIAHPEYGTTLNADHLDDLIGDICTFLKPAYRLPARTEFGGNGWNNGPYDFGWIKGSGDFEDNRGAGNPFGRADFLKTSNGAGKPLGSATNQIMDNTTFPASGNRRALGVYNIENVGLTGSYWTRTYTSSNATDVFIPKLYFTKDGISGTSSIAVHGFPVRCVKKVDPNGNY